MILEGNILINAKINEVNEKLSKLENVLPCLPNLISWEIIGDRRAKASFRVELKGVPIDYLSRITANTEITIENVNSGTIKYYFKGKGAGIGYNGLVEMRLEEVSGGTKVLWKAETDLGGFYKLLGKFIDVDKLVKKIAEDTVSGITTCISKKQS